MNYSVIQSPIQTNPNACVGRIESIGTLEMNDITKEVVNRNAGFTEAQATAVMGLVSPLLFSSNDTRTAF